MNQVLRKLTNRRCALKSNNRGMYGGGLGVNTLAPYMSANQVPIESRVYTDECYDVMRPGEIRADANPSLSQVAMAGGATAAPISSTRRFLTRRMKGGGCGCMMRRRTMRGGNRGFVVDPAFNVGGEGPNAAPANVAIPCDTRAGSANPFAVQLLGSDPRATVGYSMTPNQTPPIVGGGYAETRGPMFAYTQAGGAYAVNTHAGGAYGSGFEGPDCYKATGSQMPVYPASTAGFDFTPSTAAGASYSDGVTPFMEVNHRVARVGGRRSVRRRHRRVVKKSTRRHL